MSEANQTAVPTQARKKWNLKPGQKLMWDLSGDVMKVMPMPTNWAKYMKGLGSEVWKGVDIKKYIDEMREDRYVA